MNSIEPWYFDQNPAELYERFLGPAEFGPWAEELVKLGDPPPDHRVLDVACGTGTVTRPTPPCVGASALQPYEGENGLELPAAVYIVTAIA